MHNTVENMKQYMLSNELLVKSQRFLSNSQIVVTRKIEKQIEIFIQHTLINCFGVFILCIMILINII